MSVETFGWVLSFATATALVVMAIRLVSTMLRVALLAGLLAIGLYLIAGKTLPEPLQAWRGKIRDAISTSERWVAGANHEAKDIKAKLDSVQKRRR